IKNLLRSINMAVKINENYLLLKSNYIFVEIAQRVSNYQKENPDAEIISMGIGDVTRPLSPTVVREFQKAVTGMGEEGNFHGYGPEQGYDFLIGEIIKHDYASHDI